MLGNIKSHKIYLYNSHYITSHAKITNTKKTGIINKCDEIFKAFKYAL